MTGAHSSAVRPSSGTRIAASGGADRADPDRQPGEAPQPVEGAEADRGAEREDHDLARSQRPEERSLLQRAEAVAALATHRASLRSASASMIPVPGVASGPSRQAPGRPAPVAARRPRLSRCLSRSRRVAIRPAVARQARSASSPSSSPGSPPRGRWTRRSPCARAARRQPCCPLPPPRARRLPPPQD